MCAEHRSAIQKRVTKGSDFNIKLVYLFACCITCCSRTFCSYGDATIAGPLCNPPFLNICIIKTISLIILRSRIPHVKPHQLQSNVVRSTTRHCYQSDLGCCSQELNTQPYTYLANIHKYMHRHDMDEILPIRRKTPNNQSDPPLQFHGEMAVITINYLNETVAP